MAKVPLAPIGRPRDGFLDTGTFEKNLVAMRAWDVVLDERRARVDTHLAAAEHVSSDTRAIPGWPPERARGAARPAR